MLDRPLHAPTALGDAASSSSPRIPPIWLLGLTNGTFGMYGGFVAISLPQLLSEQHLSPGRVASITALVFTPYFSSFLLSPMLDVRFSRRFYACLLSVLSAIFLSIGILNLHHLGILQVALIAGVASGYLSASALFGWLSTVIPAQEEKRLSAWLNVGNIGGAGLMVILSGELIQRLPLHWAALLLGLAILVPLAIFPFVPAPGPDRRLASESFTAFFREIGTLLGRREILLSLVLFLAPAGSFALANIVGGLGDNYHASIHTVSLAGGVGVLLAGLIGSLSYPLLARRIALRPLYLLVGLVGAASTLFLLLLAHTPAVFVMTLFAENMFQSLAYTGAFAIQFETIGQDNPLAATAFSVMGAAVNFSNTYMIAVDGHVLETRGLAGAYLNDAVMGILACALLALLLRWTRRPGTERTPVAQHTIS